MPASRRRLATALVMLMIFAPFASAGVTNWSISTPINPDDDGVTVRSDGRSSRETLLQARISETATDDAGLDRRRRVRDSRDGLFPDTSLARRADALSAGARSTHAPLLADARARASPRARALSTRRGRRRWFTSRLSALRHLRLPRKKRDAVIHRRHVHLARCSRSPPRAVGSRRPLVEPARRSSGPRAGARRVPRPARSARAPARAVRRGTRPRRRRG